MGKQFDPTSILSDDEKAAIVNQRAKQWAAQAFSHQLNREAILARPQGRHGRHRRRAGDTEHRRGKRSQQGRRNPGGARGRRVVTTVAAMVELNSDWIGGLAGVVVALFGALAWFIRSTVATAVKELDARISTDMSDIKAHIGDLADRTHRLEQQVDEVVIPRQADIARRLHVNKRNDDDGDGNEGRIQYRIHHADQASG